MDTESNKIEIILGSSTDTNDGNVGKEKNKQAKMARFDSKDITRSPDTPNSPPIDNMDPAVFHPKNSLMSTFSRSLSRFSKQSVNASSSNSLTMDDDLIYLIATEAFESWDTSGNGVITVEGTVCIYM